MTKDELVKLAARCEAASGPDQELDREIAVAVGHPWDYAADWGSRGHERPVAFPYTASIDAAMMLVPGGWDWCLSMGAGDYAEASLAPSWKVTECSGTADTPALALCAASLRARATTTGEAK